MLEVGSNITGGKKSMFKRLMELFAIENTLALKSKRLKEVETQVDSLNGVVQDAITQARKSVDQEFTQIISSAHEQATAILLQSKNDVLQLESKKATIAEEIMGLEQTIEDCVKEMKKYEKLIQKGKVESIGIKNLIEKFPQAINFSIIEQELNAFENALSDEGILDTVVHLDLHHKNSKLLRSEMTSNNKDIKNLLSSYQTRYTTKANMSIYDLMVIGLQAELQNILYTLSYTNLDKALADSKALINKYLKIAGSGNASILPTITRFLSELEPLFENAIKIEYKYYIQKEQEKEEQRMIREQMRQEAEERRLLEEERKKIEKEEEKYLIEITKNKELLSKETDIGKIAALELRLNELQEQYEKLEEQKEEIIKRANGKAGHVYVISNLGSFGDEMFKVGMTRRLDPLERIDELGDASVPFKFDIHAMIFSDDAVGLEQKLHEILGSQRVNKINLRKEFFSVSVEGLQNIVQDIDPTVEFVTTMVAMEYRQSQSIELDEQVA
jgi:hypothetical protein